MSTQQTSLPPRLASLDAYRGFVMFLMMAEVLHLSRMALEFPGNRFWEFLADHQTHVEWSGCSLHDLIQPSFSFLVGVALPFSLASRLARGQSVVMMTFHAAWRALLLVALGVFLRSVGLPQTRFTFEDTLSQIGLGYLPLFLLGLAPRVWRWPALGALLLGYWAAFALFPLPAADFDYAAVGVPSDWPHLYSGFAAYWNKNSNLAWAFDSWFLNLFPREKPFTHNGGGYATLSFIPTLGTMILGLIAGDWLRRGTGSNGPATGVQAARLQTALNGPQRSEGSQAGRLHHDADRIAESPGEPSHGLLLGQLVLAGVVCLAAGFAADYFGVCPSVKRIWTPAWTLFSGGWCFLLMAGFYATLDAVGLRGWAFPLRVIGMNSIAAYCIAHLIGGFVIATFKTHLGQLGGFVIATLRTHLSQHAFELFGSCDPLLKGGAVLAVYWLILFWMYRRRIFLRI